MGPLAVALGERKDRRSIGRWYIITDAICMASQVVEKTGGLLVSAAAAVSPGAETWGKTGVVRSQGYTINHNTSSGLQGPSVCRNSPSSLSTLVS